MFPIGFRFSFEKEDLSGIDEPVDNSVSDRVVGKDLIELPERQVGGGDSAKPLIVPCRYYLEEQIARLCIEAHVT